MYAAFKSGLGVVGALGLGGEESVGGVLGGIETGSDGIKSPGGVALKGSKVSEGGVSSEKGVITTV